jgi:tetratricopeptide (TPR) repeat protein
MAKSGSRIRKHDMKEDSFVTFAFRAQEYIQNNQKPFILGLGALVVAVFGLWYLSSSGRRAEESADLRINEAFVRVQQNDMAGAAEIYKTVIDQYGGTSAARDGLFYLGNLSFVQQNWTEAIEAYEKFARKYGGEDPLRAGGAWSAIGDAYQTQGENEKALEAYERALAIPRAEPIFPEIYLSATRSALDMGDTARAIQYADRLLDFKSTAPQLTKVRELLALHGVVYTRGF